MNRLLLTSICKPIGPKYGDAPSVGYELLHGQVTVAQGIFSPRANHIQYGLEYIAANLQTPTTVLQYPSKKELIKELKKGYEFVGLSFILSTYHRMKETVALIRKYSPMTKIILGGYGTVISDELLKPYGDHICRSEGAAFMKELLGEPPVTGALNHPTVVSKLKVLSVPVSNTGMIFAGLGCPNGCDFCCTSHFFKRQHIKLLETGRDIYNVMERYQKIEKKMAFTVLDEDFILNKKRALEFAAAVREKGVPLSIFCFASLKALSQYEIKDLIAMGIDGLWIGVEGRRSGYEKQKGLDVETTFRKLREAGIIVLASMILGFEYQTKEIIQEELDYLLKQHPTLSQFLIYGPTPGTPFYERIMKENRMRPEFANNQETYYHQCTGFDSLVTHPSLSRDDLKNLQQHCFKQDYKKLGPSIIRTLECYLNGYLHWKDSHDPLVKAKAEMFKQDFETGAPLIPLAAFFGPSHKARKTARGLLYRAARAKCLPWMRLALLSPLTLPMALITGLNLKLNLFQHPRLIKTSYNEHGLEPLCGTLWGKKVRDWLEIKIKSYKTGEGILSPEMLQFSGKLDKTVLKQFFKRFDQIEFPTLKNLVVDFRNLEFSSDKVFAKLIKKFQDRRTTCFVLISQEMSDWLKEKRIKLRENIIFYLNEESLLASVAA